MKFKKSKMQKYLLYITLLIVFFGGLNSEVNAQRGSASDPIGTCVVTDARSYVVLETAQTTYSECRAKRVPDVKFAVWTAPGAQNYQLLAPLPCAAGEANCDQSKEFSNFDPGQSDSFTKYLNIMIKTFIGLAAVLSVVMIVMGGTLYMTSELIHSKEKGKDMIKGAIFGLIIALGAYALLFTINPDLLKTDFGSSPKAPATPPPSVNVIQFTPPENGGIINTNSPQLVR